jgi:hypothetical protein
VPIPSLSGYGFVGALVAFDGDTLQEFGSRFAVRSLPLKA